MCLVHLKSVSITFILSCLHIYVLYVTYDSYTQTHIHREMIAERWVHGVLHLFSTITKIEHIRWIWRDTFAVKLNRLHIKCCTCSQCIWIGWLEPKRQWLHFVWIFIDKMFDMETKCKLYAVKRVLDSDRIFNRETVLLSISVKSVSLDSSRMSKPSL